MLCKVERSGSSATGPVMSLNHNLYKRLPPRSFLGSLGSLGPYSLKVGWDNRHKFPRGDLLICVKKGPKKYENHWLRSIFPTATKLKFWDIFL